MGVAAGVAAVVFDLDGVLIDSEPLWQRERHALVVEYGGRWPADAQTRLMGMSTPEWARYLGTELGVRLPPGDIASAVIDRMAAAYAEQVPVLPGADAAVRRMATRWPLGLASSSPRRLIDTVLAVTGWGRLFATSLSTEQVPHGKPAPDVYRTVLARLAVPPERCVAVEDASNGLRAAAAAGLRVVAVPDPRYPPAADALAAVALVLPDLAGLTVAAVQQLA